MKGVLSKFSIYLMGSGFGALLMYAQTAVYGHYLTPDQFGAVAVISTIQLFLAGVMTFGLDTSISRLYFDHSESQQRTRVFLSSIVAGWLPISTLTALISVLILSKTMGTAFLRGADLKEFAPYVVATSLILSFFALLQALQQVERNPVGHSAIANGTKLTVLAGTILALTVSPTVAAQVIGQFLSACFFLTMTLMFCAKRFLAIPNWRISLDSLALGAPMVFYAATSFLFGVADRLILEQYHGLEAVGVYSMAQQLAQGMNVILLALARVWSPLFMGRETSGKSALPEFRFASSLFVGTACAIGVGISLFAQEILTVMGKDTYLASESILQVLLLSYVFFATYHLDSSVIYLFKRTGLLAALLCVSGAVNMLADMLFVPRWAGIGNAWASVVAFMFLSIALRISAGRMYSGKVERHRIFRMILASVLLSLVSFIGNAGLAVRVALFALLGFFLAFELWLSFRGNKVAFVDVGAR